MFGFLNVYKPKGITSHDVIYKLRKKFGIKKIGHAGTLDPSAEGVLPVAIGNATRLIDFLPTDKEYIATLKFGYISDTFDSEGVISKFSDVNFDREILENELKSFCGEITQKPPIYSAVKVKGKKLYDYARQGLKAEIPDRKIKVEYIKLLEFNTDNYTAKIVIGCSKGTYIRSIINDLGLKLNSGAYMLELIRTLSSGMNVKDSVTLDNISENSIISPNDILKLPVYILDDSQFQKVKNGNPIEIDSKYKDLIFLKYSDDIVALAEVTNGITYSKKVFAS